MKPRRSEIPTMFAALLFASMWVFPSVSPAQQKALECNSCHDTEKKIAASPHAALSCDTCHDQVKEYPHPKGLAQPACGTCHTDQDVGNIRSVHGQAAKNGNAAAPNCGSCHGTAHEAQKVRTDEFRKTVADTCGMCHTEVSEKFKQSVHGQAVSNGIQAAPICTDCHGEHSILAKDQAASPVNKANIRETCAKCHGDVKLATRFGLPQDRITSFDASFHGLAAKGGSQTVANCASCHGFHDILPSADKKSMTHADNLAKTCGQCHPGAGKRFALGTVHWLEGGNAPPAVNYVRWFYLGVIPVTIGLMLLHHGGDWIRKLFALRFRRGASAGRVDYRGPGELRMYGWERLQHGLLAISFIVLGWTGFALKYPNEWWSRPLLLWEGTWPVRGTVHRVAAVIFVACGIIHFISLFTSRRLREHWLTMIPKLRDIKEGFAQLAYNLGITSKKPKVSPHSYVEKVEYWAVVWGALVMGISGALLWFNGWAMERFPKLWLDVATAVHFYEAVLACLAIVVWHFYTVIFDPDVYPMDTAWLTGRTVRRREQKEHHAGGTAPVTVAQPVHKEAGENESQG
jgi:cytochrome b subunit of formate dehydrogenase